MHQTRCAGSRIAFSILLNCLINDADLCRSKSSLFIHKYDKKHCFNLIQVREGSQGNELSLCTYVRYICYEKLKFISSYSLENDKEWFHTYFSIKIYILEDFCIKEWLNFEIIKYPSSDHGAMDLLFCNLISGKV